LKKVVTLLVLVLACFSGKTAMAQLFLEEGKVVMEVLPGERVNKSILVTNTSDKAISVRAYWEDFEYKPPYEGAKAFVPEGTTRLSASKMMSYSPLDFNIPPFGKQKIDYSVNVPQDAKGGYYGVLFFEKAPDSFDAQTGLSIVTRVGALFFIETKGKSKDSEISSVQVEADKIKGVFHNRGDVILIPRMTYNVFDKEGLVVDRGELKKIYVPPGASANWEMSLPSNLGVGSFSLVVNTDLEDGDVIVTEINLDIDASGHLKIENIKD